ncbi:hypothetical protein ACJ72_03095 [Emergomyces africanus]|uniref:Major facilitator superfamily (MFS) profile domain-containing protein n=1 Tax=Emergomyces africanus TaxID=1955775 RepID=A0A1B7P0J1_9EURO|nr:hypothetical protein ACJ72_03095 [Emergomyces africanus]
MEFTTVEGVKMVPGTLHIVDLEGTMNVKHQNGGKSDIVLVPQPSNDPNDPLSWSKFRKEYHFWLLWIWGFLAAVCVNWVGPVWTQLTIDLKTTYFELSIASAFCFLFLGLGCVCLQPIAMKIGRRPVYIIGSLLNLVGCILGRFQTTVQMYWGTNILTGFGAAPVDSLVQITTTDIFFAHEKGTRLSMYIFTIYAGSYLSPVAAGHIADSQGWRWCYQYLIIFFSALLIIQLFTMEESTFRRPPTPSEISGDTAAMSHRARQELEPAKIGADVSHGDNGTTTEVSASAPPAPKTYWQRMGLYNTAYSDPRPLWLVAIRPFMLITYPAVIGAPYNFSVSNVGNINFSSFIGGMLGMFWGGYVSDWCIIFLSRRNKGILEPEFRLWTMLVPAIINTAGILMYGLGVLNGAMWLVPAGFGMVFIAFGIGSGGAIAITYAVDCYPRIASESLVLMLFIRNIIGCGFTFASQPWLDHNGLQNTTIIMAMICIVANMSFLLLIWKGKRLREWTAERYLILMEQKDKEAFC